jgi:hypothetical protein
MTKPLNADSMTATIKRPWCSDDKPMTPARIMEIARSKGEFAVHRYLYRSDAMRRACRRLVDAGLLKAAGRCGEFLVYEPSAALDKEGETR